MRLTYIDGGEPYMGELADLIGRYIYLHLPAHTDGRSYKRKVTWVSGHDAREEAVLEWNTGWSFVRNLRVEADGSYHLYIGGVP